MYNVHAFTRDRERTWKEREKKPNIRRQKWAARKTGKERKRMRRKRRERKRRTE